MDDWLHHTTLLGDSTLQWVIAAAAALLGYLLAQGVATFIAARLDRIAARTGHGGATIAARVAHATRPWLLLPIAVSVALYFLRAGTQHARWLYLAACVLAGIQIASWVSALLVAWLHYAAERNDARKANPVMLGVLTWLAQFVVWVTLLLMLLAEGGVNITTLVASLGVGGVAVALALQNVLGDLFASISIGLDKPFEVGEYIAFDAFEGTVTRVGIKSTRIRSQSGEELAISNSVLLKYTIRNSSRLVERRVAFKLRLPFSTPRDKLPEVVAGVRKVIAQQGRVRLDRGYVSGFGEYGIELDFAYYVLDANYDTFMSIHQRINLAILDTWHELGVEFAVPVRALRDQATATLPQGTRS